LKNIGERGAFGRRRLEVGGKRAGSSKMEVEKFGRWDAEK